LERVTEQVEIDPAAMSYLSKAGFIPGADAQVSAKGPDGTLTLQLGEHTIALGHVLADKLFVSAVA
jgi:Fe2+ transport system protein FeoA